MLWNGDDWVVGCRLQYLELWSKLGSVTFDKKEPFWYLNLNEFQIVQKTLIDEIELRYINII